MPLGVAGAGLASTIAVGGRRADAAVYFVKLEKYVGLRQLAVEAARRAYWKRILHIGLPAGGEFFADVHLHGVIYWLIRHFGADAQAGFGVGSRVMQAIFLPAMAVAFAARADRRAELRRAPRTTACARRSARAVIEAARSCWC